MICPIPGEPKRIVNTTTTRGNISIFWFPVAGFPFPAGIEPLKRATGNGIWKFAGLKISQMVYYLFYLVQLPVGCARRMRLK